jgi:hypothetical protein
MERFEREDQRSQTRGGTERKGVEKRRAGKKTAQAVFYEIRREIEELIHLAFRGRERKGRFDLESLEMFTRDVMHRCGAITLEHLLEHEDGSSLGRACECGGRFVDSKRRPKTIRSVLGEVSLTRTVQRCSRCDRWRVPEDKVLDVERTGYTPGLRRMMAKTGAEVCFDKARDFIFALAGVRVTDKDVERIAEAIGEDIAGKEEAKIEAAMRGEEPDSVESPSTLYITADGTGVPILRRETEGRKGKAPDGIARTREVKLGAIFTQTTVNDDGDPIRDPRSTTYVGKVEEAESFGHRLYAEAQRRGLRGAGRVVVIGDGAPWIWNLADMHLPGATQIVDYYHAAEHLGDVARTLFPEDKERRKSWFEPVKKKLWEGKIPSLVSELGALRVRGKKKDTIRRAIAYFEKNRQRMRYDEFRKKDLFIGSGVVEAGCKSLIGARLKQSGMHWSVRGANAIIALRCCIQSEQFEGYWEFRRAA